MDAPAPAASVDVELDFGMTRWRSTGDTRSQHATITKREWKKYPQENEKYFLNKCYVRKDKFPLELFMVLGNITSTNTEEDYGISFPELYEIYK
jgi:hypothetical protein